MSDSFSFSCPKCGATFEVPEEYCGQSAECAECNDVFTLPSLEEFQAAMSATCIIDTSEVIESDNDDENPMQDTGTVKIDRAEMIGMIPNIKESFDLEQD